MILSGGNESDCLYAPWSLPSCPFTEAMKAIVSKPPGHCLGALEMLLYKFTISSEGAHNQGENALVPAIALSKMKQTSLS